MSKHKLRSMLNPMPIKLKCRQIVQYYNNSKSSTKAFTAVNKYYCDYYNSLHIIIHTSL